MKIDSCAYLPKSRSEGIITKEIDGELLVYDRASDRAHCLNGTAALVWKLCNGQRTARVIAQALMETSSARQKSHFGGSRGRRRELRSASERFVWLALGQLRRSQLLEQDRGHDNAPRIPAISGFPSISRREAVRRIGRGAALAVPLVVTITAPTAAEAAVSCGATCHPCNSPVDCCGVCSIVVVPGCGPTTPRCT